MRPRVLGGFDLTVRNGSPWRSKRSETTPRNADREPRWFLEMPPGSRFMKAWCVVACLPSSSPARANFEEPIQTDITFHKVKTAIATFAVRKGASLPVNRSRSTRRWRLNLS